ncbi:Zinc finger protein 260 [Eumeta japonica]|uniref:Zinc finger protein 260 n=1 Tax=Eumeta variegata TaxID=151549 RepID=A0A4C1WIE2_EUMVA|nr:Zinc finger protein 260 [Eumeta japonica]
MHHMRQTIYTERFASGARAHSQHSGPDTPMCGMRCPVQVAGGAGTPPPASFRRSAARVRIVPSHLPPTPRASSARGGALGLALARLRAVRCRLPPPPRARTPLAKPVRHSPAAAQVRGRARPSPCHLLSVHADRLFHCDECNTYVDRTDLIRHMSSHAVQYAAGPSPAPDAAPAPRSDFSDRSDTDEGFGPLPDSVFEAIEDSQDGVPPSHPHSSPLPTAMPAAVEHGNRQAKKKRTCAVCTKTFTAASSYFYHVKHVHTDGESKRHECGVCGRRFGTRAYLADHTTVHTGERRFACDRCGKLFRTRASLHIHAQTHAERRPWKCTRCPRAFACRQKLARHEVRHAAERAHACTACGRRFAMRYDLQRHERTHAAPQRHACVRCGAVYAQLRYLRVHCNKKHPADPGALPPAATHATASLPTPIPHR